MMPMKIPHLKQIVPYDNKNEIELILKCSKRLDNISNRDTILYILKTELNWDYIYEKALKNRLIPLIYYNLNIIAPELVPEDILQRMRKIYLLSMKKAMIQTRELHQVIQILTDNKIPVIPYKGVTLSLQIYGDIGLRISDDIDLIIHQKDLILTKDLLISQGYSPQISLSTEQDKKFIKVNHEYHFSHLSKTLIDVHWQLMKSYYVDPFDETDIWSGLKVISLEGQEVSYLSTELLIIFLLIHGAKHQWNDLRPICDVASIIASEKDISWELILKTAKLKRIERIIFLGLTLVREVTDTNLPQFVSEAMRSNYSKDQQINEIIQQLFIDNQKQEGDIQFVFYWISIRECIWDKFKVIVLLMLKPNDDDWTYISLPGILSPLYYVIRPVRLIYEYGIPQCLNKFIRK